MAKPCRIFDLQSAASLLAGADIEPEECDAEAKHLAIFATDADGFVIEITTPVCDFHDVWVASTAVGYKTSIKLRTPS